MSSYQDLMNFDLRFKFKFFKFIFRLLNLNCKGSKSTYNWGENIVLICNCVAGNRELNTLYLDNQVRNHESFGLNFALFWEFPWYLWKYSSRIKGAFVARESKLCQPSGDWATSIDVRKDVEGWKVVQRSRTERYVQLRGQFCQCPIMFQTTGFFLDVLHKGQHEV